MIIEEHDFPWTRKHDDPRTPLIPAAPRIVYPRDLHELIEVCAGGGALKAAGSHWGLSMSALSDDTFIETNDPDGTHPTLSRTLHDVVPSCLNRNYLRYMADAEDVWYLIHIEAGKRVCQLYAELDQLVDVTDERTLGGYIKKNIRDTDKFARRWGFATLLIAPLALGNRGWYAGLLATRPMVWLGEISYEIFLVHLVIMEIAMVNVLHWPVYTGSAPALFVVTLLMTVPVAWVLHRFTRVRT